jgi:hypothetical protein
MLFWSAAAALTASLAASPSWAETQEEIPIAIAAFDNDDTAGESPEAVEAHAARVQGFSGLIEERLAAEDAYKIVSLTCDAPPCSAGSMAPEDLIAAARQAGARLLVYGGIHKMSSLVQLGKVQAVDLEKDALVFDQSFQFRGDNDEAFSRAADFVARYLAEAAPAE